MSPGVGLGAFFALGWAVLCVFQPEGIRAVRLGASGPCRATPFQCNVSVRWQAWRGGKRQTVQGRLSSANLRMCSGTAAWIGCARARRLSPVWAY
jgi:hypothetical protein